MATKLDIFNKQYLRANLPEIKPGDTVKVHQRIKEGEKERIQVFEGTAIAVKHGRGISSSITVRKLISGIGVEKVFPLHLPAIEKIEVTKHGRVRRAKLYYLRALKGKKAKLKKTAAE